METRVTEQERQSMMHQFRSLVNNMRLFHLFPRRQREILAQRLTDIAVAEKENKEPPDFPPEGFEVVLTKLGVDGNELSATMQRYVSSNPKNHPELFPELISSDNEPVGPVIEEEPKVDVPVKNVF